MKEKPSNNINSKRIKQDAVSLAHKVWWDSSILWKHELVSEILDSNKAKTYFTCYFESKWVEVDNAILDKIELAWPSIFESFDKTKFDILTEKFEDIPLSYFTEITIENWDWKINYFPMLINRDWNPNILNYLINLPNTEISCITQHKLNTCCQCDWKNFSFIIDRYDFDNRQEVEHTINDAWRWNLLQQNCFEMFKYLHSKFSIKKEDISMILQSLFIDNNTNESSHLIDFTEKTIADKNITNYEDLFDDNDFIEKIHLINKFYSHSNEVNFEYFYTNILQKIVCEWIFRLSRKDIIINIIKHIAPKIEEFILYKDLIETIEVNGDIYHEGGYSWSYNINELLWCINEFDLFENHCIFDPGMIHILYYNDYVQSDLNIIFEKYNINLDWQKEKANYLWLYLEYHKKLSSMNHILSKNEIAKIYEAIWKIKKLPSTFMLWSGRDENGNFYDYCEKHLHYISQNTHKTSEYFQILEKLWNSKVKLFRNKLLGEVIMKQILQNSNWVKILESLENAYIINDNNCRTEFPDVYKIFTSFSIIQNETEIIKKVSQDIKDITQQWVGSKYLRNYTSNYPKLIEIFYIIFMKISIDSSNKDILNYIDFLKKWQIALDTKNQEVLAFTYLNNISQLVQMFVPWKIFYTIDTSKLNIDEYEKKVTTRVQNIWKILWYDFSDKTLLESVEFLITEPLWIWGFEWIIRSRNDSKEKANQKAKVLGANELKLEEWDMIKWVSSKYIESYFDNGIRCSEALWESSWQNYTWLSTDFWMTNGDISSVQNTISSNLASWYWDWMYFIIKKDTDSFINTEFMTVEETHMIDIKKQDEFIANHYAHEWNYSILWWLGINKVSAIVLNDNLLGDQEFLYKLKLTIAKSWVYKPLYNMNWISIFWKSDFDDIEEYWKVLDWEFPEDLHLKINKSNILNLWVDEIFDILESYPGIKQRLSMDVWVVEGYTLWQHTKMWLTQFDKYFKWKWFFDHTVLSEELFVAMYLYHDWGKPLSILYWSEWQHSYTKKNIWFFLKSLWFTNHKEIILASEIACQDIIWDMIRGKISQDQAQNKILWFANKLGISPIELFKTMKIYSMIDWSSYTTDAWWKQGYGFDASFDFSGWTINYVGTIDEQILKLEKSINITFLPN